MRRNASVHKRFIIFAHVERLLRHTLTRATHRRRDVAKLRSGLQSNYCQKFHFDVVCVCVWERVACIGRAARRDRLGVCAAIRLNFSIFSDMKTISVYRTALLFVHPIQFYNLSPMHQCRYEYKQWQTPRWWAEDGPFPSANNAFPSIFPSPAGILGRMGGGGENGKLNGIIEDARKRETVHSALSDKKSGKTKTIESDQRH